MYIILNLRRFIGWYGNINWFSCFLYVFLIGFDILFWGLVGLIRFGRNVEFEKNNDYGIMIINGYFLVFCRKYSGYKNI